MSSKINEHEAKRSELFKLMDFLYLNGTVFLERKKEKYEEFSSFFANIKI